MGKLECNGLTKIYEDHRKALENVTFTVETSGIFGLIGRNGAGKTTLIRILATELQPTAGTAIEGGLIMNFFASGIAMSSDLSHLKNDFKLQDMIVSSPTSSRLYMGGMALAEIVYSIPSLAILVALAAVYVHPSLVQVGVMFVVLTLMFAMAVALGFMLSTFSSDVVQSYAFTRLLSLLFTTLPPVYYPITYIPQTFRYFAYLSPTTYAAELIHSATGYITVPLSLVIFDWVILAGVSAVILLIAYKKTRWKDV